jgi:hypothetical protein
MVLGRQAVPESAFADRAAEESLSYRPHSREAIAALEFARRKRQFLPPGRNGGGGAAIPLPVTRLNLLI